MEKNTFDKSVAAFSVPRAVLIFSNKDLPPGVVAVIRTTLWLSLGHSLMVVSRIHLVFGRN